MALTSDTVYRLMGKNRMRHSGANFCHVSRVAKPLWPTRLATGGTQKWRGANPIFKSKPRAANSINAHTGERPPYKSKSEPTLCTTK